MRIASLAEEKEISKFFTEAAHVAGQSLCKRARCSSVIVKDGEIIARGFNSPPQNNANFRTCVDEYDIPIGFRHDRTCCIHAEQRTVMDALKNGKDMRGSRIYFTRVDEKGEQIKSTRLQCTICSRAVLDAGIAEFALWFDDGIRIYTAAEVNALSYEYKTPKKQ
ncbi:MAG: hypothetical protein HYW88_00915 [Candidatus Sungbacteria bacterium]|nr:hypothetical protein [Candidatus Sungbacteria bacterium]